jgi:ribosome-associated protein
MSAADPQQRFAKVKRIVEAALERNAERPVALDISGLTAFADAFVLLSGRSDRQVRAIADSILQTLTAEGDEPLGVEGLEEGRWVLIDCNDVVVHVFEPDMRDLYALERLWSDAPAIDLEALGVDPAALAAATPAGDPLREGGAARAEESLR